MASNKEGTVAKLGFVAHKRDQLKHELAGDAATLLLACLSLIPCAFQSWEKSTPGKSSTDFDLLLGVNNSSFFWRI
jgi:hypothetical protein